MYGQVSRSVKSSHVAIHVHLWHRHPPKETLMRAPVRRAQPQFQVSLHAVDCTSTWVHLWHRHHPKEALMMAGPLWAWLQKNIFCTELFFLPYVLSMIVRKYFKANLKHKHCGFKRKAPQSKWSCMDCPNVRNLLVQMDGGPLDRLCYVNLDRTITNFIKVNIFARSKL